MIDTFTYVANGETFTATVTVTSELERHALSTDGTLVGQINPENRTLTTNQVIAAGQVLSGALIKAYVTVQAGGVLEDCKVVGAGPGRHLVQVEPGGIMRDATIEPANPAWHVEGARLTGTATQTAGIITRCDISAVGDCIGLTGGNNGQVTRNYLHEQVLLSPDPGRGNTDTSHDDLIQLHGGTGWDIGYNEMAAYFAYGPLDVPFSENPSTGVVSGNPQYPKTNSMSMMMFTLIKNDGQYPRGIKFHHNHGLGGVVGLNLGALGAGTAGATIVEITDNLFSTDQVYNGHDKTPILVANSMPTSLITLARNYYPDGTPALRRQS